MHYLLVDTSNMLHRCFATNKFEDVETATGLAHHVALMTLRKYFNENEPDKVVLAFDRSSWRKDYTKSDVCVSKKLYKGDRRQKQTPLEKERYEKFLEHVNEFEEMMTEHTSAICLAGDKLEADDLIAGWVDMHPDDKITLVSADKDFVQLLDHDDIRLIDPLTNKPRLMKEDSFEYHLFLKCIRANEDNIQCAFPNVRETRIKKAFNDPFEMTSLMEHVWEREDGIKFRVGDLYEENRHLMDLRAQPSHIRQHIVKTIMACETNPGKFDMFSFLRFCGKFKLETIKQQFDNFVPLLSK